MSINPPNTFSRAEWWRVKKKCCSMTSTMDGHDVIFTNITYFDNIDEDDEEA